MGNFIQQNAIWVIPIVSIILVIAFKITAKPEFLSLSYIDYLDFGFDLSVTSIVLLLTNIHNNTGAWILVIAIVFVIIIANVVKRLCWNKKTQQQKLGAVLIPDIMGIIILLIISLYIGGVIR